MYQIWKLHAVKLLYQTLVVNLKQSVKRDCDFERLRWSFTEARRLVRKLEEVVVHFETAATRTNQGKRQWTRVQDQLCSRAHMNPEKDKLHNCFRKVANWSRWESKDHQVPPSRISYYLVFQTWCHSSEGRGAGEKNSPQSGKKKPNNNPKLNQLPTCAKSGWNVQG